MQMLHQLLWMMYEVVELLLNLLLVLQYSPLSSSSFSCFWFSIHEFEMYPLLQCFKILCEKLTISIFNGFSFCNNSISGGKTTLFLVSSRGWHWIGACGMNLAQSFWWYYFCLMDCISVISFPLNIHWNGSNQMHAVISPPPTELQMQSSSSSSNSSALFFFLGGIVFLTILLILIVVFWKFVKPSDIVKFLLRRTKRQKGKLIMSV